MCQRTCPECGGLGGWVVARSSWDGIDVEEHEEQCPVCRGLGIVDGEPEQLTIEDADERSGDNDDN